MDYRGFLELVHEAFRFPMIKGLLKEKEETIKKTSVRLLKKPQGGC